MPEHGGEVALDVNSFPFERSGVEQVDLVFSMGVVDERADEVRTLLVCVDGGTTGDQDLAVRQDSGGELGQLARVVAGLGRRAPSAGGSVKDAQLGVLVLAEVGPPDEDLVTDAGDQEVLPLWRGPFGIDGLDFPPFVVGIYVPGAESQTSGGRVLYVRGTNDPDLVSDLRGQEAFQVGIRQSSVSIQVVVFCAGEFETDTPIRIDSVQATIGLVDKGFDPAGRSSLQIIFVWAGGFVQSPGVQFSVPLQVVRTSQRPLLLRDVNSSSRNFPREVQRKGINVMPNNHAFTNYKSGVINNSLRGLRQWSNSNNNIAGDRLLNLWGSRCMAVCILASNCERRINVWEDGQGCEGWCRK